jgi:hypothetical protein
MSAHPYISGAGNVTQLIRYLKRSFPPTVTADTIKKLSLASKNESYLINVLQFLGLITEDGKRTDNGVRILTIHDEEQFQREFSELVKAAYDDLFIVRGDDAWTMGRDDLIGYFRGADKTSEIIGSRQAGVFIALRELAGYATKNFESKSQSTKITSTKKSRMSLKHRAKADNVFPQETKNKTVSGKLDAALTVRVEVNLPTEASQETYDAIFKSIKENLFS